MDSYFDLLAVRNGDSNEASCDDSQSASPPEEQDYQEAAIVEATPSTKRRGKRTKNYTEKEDNMVVRAWLETSLDAVPGTGQPRGKYWLRIYHYFHKHKDFESDRNCNSIMHRWSTIQDSVSIFCGCYDQIQDRRQSGVTEQEKVLQACELYKSKDKHGKSFGFLHCWRNLQHEPKWKDRCSNLKRPLVALASFEGPLAISPPPLAITGEELEPPLPPPPQTDKEGSPFPPSRVLDQMDRYLDLLDGQNVVSNETSCHDSQSANPLKEQDCQEPAIVEATPSMKRKGRRTKNYSEKEDNLLVRAWLETSMDAAPGTGQPSGYWQRIHYYFHSHKDFESDRSCNSLMHRWSAILESVSRFCVCYAQIQNRRQNGTTHQDKVLQACELYKSKDKHGKSFGFLHCWSILRHEQRWKNRFSQKKQKTSDDASPRSSTPESNESHHDDAGEDVTPKCQHKGSVSPGDNHRRVEASENTSAKKKEAETLIGSKRKDMNDERIALEKKKLELMERDLELRQRIEDDKVMNMDISSMNERQKQYYMRLQDEIIARRFGVGSS